jgi:hypothetical protein
MAQLTEAIQGYKYFNKPQVGLPLDERTFSFDRETDLTFAELQQPLHLSLVISWAQSLPSGSILDPAAGVAIEMGRLHDMGFDCYALDVSPYMVNNMHIPQDRRGIGSLDKINVPDNILAGIFLSYIVVLLSPPQREKVFREINRCLVQGGEVLVISDACKSSNVELAFEKGDGKYYKREIYPSDDYPDYSWEREVADAQKSGGKIVSLNWRCTPEIIKEIAGRNGFEIVSVERYNDGHPFVNEARWNNINLFNPLIDPDHLAAFSMILKKVGSPSDLPFSVKTQSLAT